MIPRLLFLFAFLIGSAQSEEWSLDQPIEDLRESYVLPRGLAEGPFRITAKLTIPKFEGTASSIRMGDLNFGFEGRTTQIFVEGGPVDGVRSVAPTRDHLKEGEPFAFLAVRDRAGKLTVSLNGKEVWSIADWKGDAGSVALRPHRGSFFVHQLGLEGTFLPQEKKRPFVVIHKQGQFDCHTFRIPGIARTKSGALLAVFDLRYRSRRDLQGHMDIGLMRSEDGGETWTDPVPIMDMGTHGGKPEDENGCSDPNILVDEETGEIFVAACWTHGKPGTHQWRGNGSEPGLGIDVSTQFMVVRSTDDGKTWSQPENWTKALKDPAWHLFAPAPGNGITLEDGTLVMPTQGRDESGLPFSNLIWSKDRGKTWNQGTMARRNTTECAVAELSDGTLMLNMRDNRNRSDKSETNGRAVGVTNDLGKTWKVHSTDHGALPEPVCMASLISHVDVQGRRFLFFSNPNSKSHRRGMTVRMSLDDGKTWPKEKQILLDANGGAYSSLVMIDDQTLGILYESSRADLVFQKISLSEFGLE